MKALVTGATGFVGAHIIGALGVEGIEARALHRSTSRMDALAGLAYESALGDVTDLESLRTACEGCDWVFHVAAVADYWRADQRRMVEVNVEGTRRVLQAARETGAQRVIFTSSAAAVGFRGSPPADETVAFNLPPERFPYGYSKVQAEAVALEAVDAGQEVVIVNPVVVLGPGDLNVISGDFVLKVKRLQWTIPVPPGGIAVVDVRDVARMQIAAARQGRVGERYILGTANYTMADWFRLIAEVVDAAAPVLPVPGWALAPLANLFDAARSAGLQLPVDGNQLRLGTQNIFFDYTKAHGELCPPSIDMRQSIADTYAWYAENGYIKRDFIARAIEGIAKLWR